MALACRCSRPRSHSIFASHPRSPKLTLFLLAPMSRSSGISFLSIQSPGKGGWEHGRWGVRRDHVIPALGSTHHSLKWQQSPATTLTHFTSISTDESEESQGPGDISRTQLTGSKGTLRGKVMEKLHWPHPPAQENFLIFSRPVTSPFLSVFLLESFSLPCWLSQLVP